MIRIAVCDDQKMVCEKLREMILCGEESQYEVDLFQGGEEFLNAKGQYDILFLDIDFSCLHFF